MVVDCERVASISRATSRTAGRLQKMSNFDKLAKTKAIIVKKW